MRALLDLVVPPACAGCGRAGALLCPACRDGFRPTAEPSARFVAADPGVVVGRALTLGIGTFVYEGALRRALGRLKYAGAGRVADDLARAARPAFERLVAISGPAMLVPVPIHVERQRQRGYNQAALIARRLAEGSSHPMADLLARASVTERQHRLDRAGRLRNLRSAITLRDGVAAPPVAIVIDDILTSAATLEACAGALLAGGSTEVYGFAIAREV